MDVEEVEDVIVEAEDGPLVGTEDETEGSVFHFQEASVMEAATANSSNTARFSRGHMAFPDASGNNLNTFVDQWRSLDEQTLD